MTSNMEANDLGPLLAGETLPIAPPADRFLAAGWRLARKVGRSLRRWSERSIVIADCDRAIAKDRPETGGCP
jgi:hypothetical protein